MEFTSAEVLGHVSTNNYATIRFRSLHCEFSIWNKDSSLKFSKVRSVSQSNILGIVKVPQDARRDVRIEITTIRIIKVAHFLDQNISVAVGFHVDDDCLTFQAGIEPHVNGIIQVRYRVHA